MCLPIRAKLFLSHSPAVLLDSGRIEARGYETLYCSGAYSNHLSPDPDLGCVDSIYVDGETAERLFANSRAAGPWRHDGASGFAPFTLAED